VLIQRDHATDHGVRREDLLPPLTARTSWAAVADEGYRPRTHWAKLGKRSADD
jgi:hypothetical protein